MEHHLDIDAIAINNQGVAHLENGDCDQALRLFSKALHGIKSEMGNLSKEAETSSCGSNVGFKWSKNAPIQADLRLLVPAEIYVHALIIAPIFDEPTRSSAFDEEITSIMYNLTLSLFWFQVS